MVLPVDFRPDEDVVAALDAAVPSLSSGGNLFAGPVEAYSQASGIPHAAVFVTASGGLPSRELKGNALGLTSERKPTINIRIRSAGTGVPTAFPDGQTLSKEIFEALHHKPPTANYCESESLNSHPSYFGRDDDGHHEWVILVQLTIDVVQP